MLLHRSAYDERVVVVGAEPLLRDMLNYLELFDEGLTHDDLATLTGADLSAVGRSCSALADAGHVWFEAEPWDPRQGHVSRGRVRERVVATTARPPVEAI